MTTGMDTGPGSNMLREILEQPSSLAACIETFESGAGSNLLDQAIHQLLSRRHIVIAATGSSRHAALVAARMFRGAWNADVLVTTSGEFRDLPEALKSSASLLAVSQSGETTDTVEAMIAARRSGCPVVALTNAASSSLALGADVALNLPIGRELAIPATKSFTGQLLVLLLVITRHTSLNGAPDSLSLPEQARRLPEALARQYNDWITAMRHFAEACSIGSMYLLGQNFDSAIALEGALKLKETAYVHAEGLHTGEVEHGPKALIAEGMPILLIEPSHFQFGAFDRSLGSRLQALGADLIRVTESKGADCVTIERAHPYISCIQKTVPLQLFAYYVAKRRGTEIDSPRHLAKSVVLSG